MPRPASPAQSAASDPSLAERTAHAPQDPPERTYRSVSKSLNPYSSSASASSLSLWSGKKLLTGSQSRSALSSPRSLSPTSDTSSCYQSPPTNIRMPREDFAALYANSLMVGPFGTFAPTPMPTPRTPRSKAKISVEPLTPPAPLPSPDKGPKLSMKKVRRLMSRRSISSLDALADDHDGDQEDEPSPLETPLSYFDHARLSSEMDPHANRPDDIKVFVPDDGSDSPRIYTHFVVGDVWEERDISEVIPVLRSMKFAGKF